MITDPAQTSFTIVSNKRKKKRRRRKKEEEKMKLDVGHVRYDM